MAFSVEYVFNSLTIRSLSRPHGRGSWGGGSEHQLRGVVERCKLHSGVQGGALAAEGFSCILCRQIAFPASQ